MAERNTILEKDPTQSRVVAVKRGFHPLLQLHAAFLPDLLFADAVQCPKTGLQVEEQEVFVSLLSLPLPAL